MEIHIELTPWHILKSLWKYSFGLNEGLRPGDAGSDDAAIVARNNPCCLLAFIPTRVGRN